MNKICTTVKQSKKLIELGIDVNTADMRYMYRHWEIDENTVGAQSDASIGFDSDFYYGADNGKTYHYIPAWSLSALLELIPPYLEEFKDGIDFGFSKSMNGKWYSAHYIQLDNSGLVTFHKTVTGDTSVDAVFEMIVWLKENGKL